MSALPTVSIVVVTYRREAVLVDTVERLLGLAPRAEELLVVDQTASHEPGVEARLRAWSRSGEISWIRRDAPSIPAAMNDGLVRASGDVALFVDDDVVPGSDLVDRHRDLHAAGAAEIVAGQVLEPGESAEPLSGDRFAFRSSIEQPVDEVIGCNFSVRRELALGIGGFDENFVAVAYRFEAEFCERARGAGARIRFSPSASLRHLRAPAGGVRSHGDHLRTIRPTHAVGEYYFLMTSRAPRRWRRLLERPVRAVRTRHHLRHPWWIPVTLTAELGGFLWACALRVRGPRHLPPPESDR